MIQQVRFAAASAQDATTTARFAPVRHGSPEADQAAELIPTQREASQGMRLVTSRGPEQGREFEISAPATKIGRQRDCDIVLEDSTVSRYHAELVVEDGRCVLVDGGSLNGTFVNRCQVSSVELADGDEVWIGKMRFVFHTGTAA